MRVFESAKWRQPPFDFQWVRGVHVVMVMVWSYSGPFQIRCLYFLSVHFDLQASMRLLQMDYQSVIVLETKSVTFVLLSMLLSESASVVLIVAYSR